MTISGNKINPILAKNMAIASFIDIPQKIRYGLEIVSLHTFNLFFVFHYIKIQRLVLG